MEKLDKAVFAAYIVAITREPKASGCGQLDLADTLRLLTEIDGELLGGLMNVPNSFCDGFGAGVAYASIPDGADAYGRNVIDFINYVYRKKALLGELEKSMAGDGR